MTDRQQPDLGHLRKEAKLLLRALADGEPSARRRHEAFAPDLPVQLSTAQLILAREHGHPSWPALRAIVSPGDGGGARYDAIGDGYASRRIADPRIEAVIHEALAGARTVVHVGAGAGSYEPTDRPVTAIEPSIAMARQRPPQLPAAVQAAAEKLPLPDKSVDAALAVLTVHHWSDRRRGILELKRVARRRIVVLTIDAEVEADMWLFADYAPEFLERDRREFPAPTSIEAWLDVPIESEVIPVPADCTDGFASAYWSRPEALLDPGARAATSGFARMHPENESAVVQRLSADLASGTWDARYGHLRELASLDVGLRLIVAELSG